MLDPPPFRDPSSTGIGTDDGTVDNEVSHVWIIHEMLMHLVPDVMVTPTGKSLVNCVLIAVIFRQKPPLGPAAGDPEHRCDKKTAFFCFPGIHSGMIFQKEIDFFPLVVS